MRVEPKRLRRLGNGQLLVDRDGSLRSVAINGNQWQSMAPTWYGSLAQGAHCGIRADGHGNQWQSMAPTWYGSLRALIVGFGPMGNGSRAVITLRGVPVRASSVATCMQLGGEVKPSACNREGVELGGSQRHAE